jgi:protein-tyrosine phosphatase
MVNKRILMVCIGNICRSPLAEGILREKLRSRKSDILIDSAGTGSYHIGEHPDARAIKIAKKYGIDISQLRARQFSSKDFDKFDLIYVMDRFNQEDVISLARNKNDENKVYLFLEASGNKEITDVPDPWYGDMDDFDKVFKLLNDACEKLADSILKEIASSESK